VSSGTISDPTLIPRIVGGNEATPHSWPWQVALLVDNGFCGGSLIDSNWIMTAAHCFNKDTLAADLAKISVILGAHNLREDEASRRICNVSQVIIHEAYDSKTMQNDIALVRLNCSGGLTFTEQISPVCLPSPVDNFQNAGTQVLVSGWGTIKFGGEQPDALQEVVVATVDLSECVNAYTGSPDITKAPNWMCAAAVGRDSCQGDSGGPLVA